MDRCFPAVIGNEKLKRRLALEIEEGRFPHAYILAGRDGSGKMTLAMNIAAALACKSRHTLPCGECDSCRKILGGFSPDVLILRKEEGKTTDRFTVICFIVIFVTSLMALIICVFKYYINSF